MILFGIVGGEVAFIDYNKGDKAGYVRLTTENTAKPFVEKLNDSKVKMSLFYFDSITKFIIILFFLFFLSFLVNC